MVAEVTALDETEVCSGEAEFLLFKYFNAVLGLSYSSKGLFVGTALHYSCFFYSEDNLRSPSEILCIPCLSSFNMRCQPSWHTNEPARRCTECTNKQLVSV